MAERSLKLLSRQFGGTRGVASGGWGRGGVSLTAGQDIQTIKVAPPDFYSCKLPLRKIFSDKFIIFLL